MTYRIEFEDHGQDLTHLLVNAEDGTIEGAGLCDWLYLNKGISVDTTQLLEDRMVHYSDAEGIERQFKYPMTRLSLDGEVLAQAAG